MPTIELTTEELYELIAYILRLREMIAVRYNSDPNAEAARAIEKLRQAEEEDSDPGDLGSTNGTE